MSEKQIEQYLRKRVEELGGWAPKFISPGNAGAPDRLIILRGGRIVFVELKSPGETSTPIQRYQQHRLKRLGCIVYADVDSKSAVDEMLERLDKDLELCTACLSEIQHFTNPDGTCLWSVPGDGLR